LGHHQLVICQVVVHAKLVEESLEQPLGEYAFKLIYSFKLILKLIYSLKSNLKSN